MSGSRGNSVSASDLTQVCWSANTGKMRRFCGGSDRVRRRETHRNLFGPTHLTDDPRSVGEPLAFCFCPEPPDSMWRKQKCARGVGVAVGSVHQFRRCHSELVKRARRGSSWASKRQRRFRRRGCSDQYHAGRRHRLFHGTRWRRRGRAVEDRRNHRGDAACEGHQPRSRRLLPVGVHDDQWHHILLWPGRHGRESARRYHRDERGHVADEKHLSGPGRFQPRPAPASGCCFTSSPTTKSTGRSFGAATGPMPARNW